MQWAKSYIGYMLYLFPVLGWAFDLRLYIIGSLKVGFADLGSAFNLKVWYYYKFGNNLKFSLIDLYLYILMLFYLL
jgi:hypothetical protein